MYYGEWDQTDYDETNYMSSSFEYFLFQCAVLKYEGMFYKESIYFGSSPLSFEESADKRQNDTLESIMKTFVEKYNLECAWFNNDYFFHAHNKDISIILDKRGAVGGKIMGNDMQQMEEFIKPLLDTIGATIQKKIKGRHLMNKKYTEYCMKFSNEELKKYIYDKIFENINTQIQCLSEDEEQVDITSNIRIETISFDEKENISIMFFGYQTSIFAYDAEIMFIDESAKGTYTSSDVYGNAVYEGNLREMSHEEMLQMFSEIIMCLIDATDVLMTTLAAPENKYKKYKYYTPHMFMFEVKNNHLTEKINVYENITIKH